MAGRSPEIIGGVNGDPRLPGSREIGSHRRSDHVHLLRENGVYVGLNWIEPWRNENSRGVCTLLVNVINDLGMPAILNSANGGSSLGLRKDIPVAVVVVPGVVVIEFG